MIVAVAVTLAPFVAAQIGYAGYGALLASGLVLAPCGFLNQTLGWGWTMRDSITKWLVSGTIINALLGVFLGYLLALWRRRIFARYSEK